MESLVWEEKLVRIKTHSLIGEPNGRSANVKVLYTQFRSWPRAGYRVRRFNSVVCFNTRIRNSAKQIYWGFA